jgi:hypothetical protein
LYTNDKAPFGVVKQPFGKSGDMTRLAVLSLQVLPSYPICSAKGA